MEDLYVTEGYISEDYFANSPKIIQTFQQLDDQLAKLRSVLQIEKEELVPVQIGGTVSMIRDWEYGGFCQYNGTSAHIYTRSVHYLCHEYTHYLFLLLGGWMIQHLSHG